MTDNTPTTQSPAGIDAAMRADIPRLRDAFLALSAAYSFAKESVREDGDRSCVHPLAADDLAIVKHVVNRVAIMLEDGTYGAEGFLASVGVTIDVVSLRERTRQAEALAQILREERDACAQEVLAQRETIARLTRERDTWGSAARSYERLTREQASTYTDALAALDAALSAIRADLHCDECGKPATRKHEEGDVCCDQCAGGTGWADLPHAAAVRAAMETT